MVKKSDNNKDSSVVSFTKAQWLGAKRYQDVKDLLQACLKEDTTYTEEQLTKALEAFKGGI